MSFPQRPLLFGPNGWLGSKLVELMCADATLARIDHPEEVRDAIDQYNPDMVINCAGIKGVPNIDWCSATPENQNLTWRANVYGPDNLARACRGRAMLVHLSTGCLFTGPSPHLDGRWREDDVPSPVNFYGRTKLAGETVILESGVESLIVRLRMPITSEPVPGNLITKLASYQQVIDVRNSVTVVPDFLQAIQQLVAQRCRGIYHVTNPGAVRHSEILAWYREVVDQSHTYTLREPDAIAELTAEPRSECVLDTSKLEQAGVCLPVAEESIKQCLVRYRNALARSL